MHVVDSSTIGRAANGVKSTAFLAASEQTLVVHVVNALDQDAPVSIKLTGKFARATTAERHRTSAREDAANLPALTGTAGTFTDTLPARSMVTLIVEAPAK
jgi:predicted dinucleotide-utilizing enzyme